MTPTFRRQLRAAGFTAALTMTVFTLLGALPGCRKPAESTVRTALAAAASKPAIPPSTDCRACHEDIYNNWSHSHHALANRPVDAEKDADAFGSVQEFSAHGIDYRLEWKDAKPHVTEKREGADATETYLADHVLGHTPLRQYVVPIGKGRFQAAELVWDPAKKEWFNVFGDERRQPGEWGHWTGRGMNWNSMCAHCHMTGYDKNYDLISDSYSTTWTEHGIGCASCHAMPADHGKNPAAAVALDLTPEALAARRHQAMETCAPCHARNELLTGNIRAGLSYHDHYRLTLPTDPAVFYPDGQVLDENFNYTSHLISRMGGKAGVTCLDCHEPHSGKTLLPVTNNALCLQCHGAPGRDTAIVIDPLAHSRHAAGSTGNQCVSCHMPTTTYMQRDPRHDHGFIKPDPLLTKELGIPNACNGCHTDQSVDWAIEHSGRWYGDKLDSRQRSRTRAVAAAQRGEPDALGPLLEHIADEEVPAWKATMISLTRAYAGADPRVLTVAREATRHSDPMVRSAGAQVLAGVPGEEATLRPLLDDPVRLVRLDAAWPLSAELPAGGKMRNELDAYLAVSADQPLGRLRMGQDLYNRGRVSEAVAHMQAAAQWDPNSPGLHDALGIVLNELGRPAEAGSALWRAAQLDPGNASAAFNAGLAFAGAGRLADAEAALRETVRRDARFDRAWYNLGLLLAQTQRMTDGIAALRTAEQIAPQIADYPYARATLHWQRGERAEAIAAAQQALVANPAHAQARALLRQAGL